MAKRVVKTSLSFTGYQLIGHVLCKIAAKYHFKLIIVGRRSKVTSVLFEAFKKMNFKEIKFIETENDAIALQQAMDVIHTGSLVLLLVSSHSIQKTIGELSLAILSEMPLLIINMQEHPMLSTVEQQHMQTDLAFYSHSTFEGLQVPIIGFSTDYNQLHSLQIFVEIAYKFMTPIILLVDVPSVSKCYELEPSKLNAVRLDKDALMTFYRNWSAQGVDEDLSFLGKQLLGLSIDKFQTEITYFQRKMRDLAASKHAYSIVSRNACSRYALVGWGTTEALVALVMKSPLLLALKFSHLHLNLVYPLPAGFIEKANKFERLFVVEFNAGQLAVCLKNNTSAQISSINRYDGKYFTVDEILSSIEKILLEKS